MTCRQCGTEISGNALICYRCGTATSEARYQPYSVPARRARSRTVVTIALAAVLVLVAWFLLHSHWL